MVLEHDEMREMTIERQIEMVIREWQSGCCCATPGRPWECVVCTDGAHHAIDYYITQWKWDLRNASYGKETIQ